MTVLQAALFPLCKIILPPVAGLVRHVSWSLPSSWILWVSIAANGWIRGRGK